MEPTHHPPGQSCSPGQHCYHGIGDLYLCDPPRRDFVCCYCGAKRRFVVQAAQDNEGHGPHLPRKEEGYENH